MVPNGARTYYLNRSDPPLLIRMVYDYVNCGPRHRLDLRHYWDSFWIILGTLHLGGDFVDITRNMIHNWIDFVDHYGFIPNGARSYYLSRSDPPLLTRMVRTYIDMTDNSTRHSRLLDYALPLLERELMWWNTNRVRRLPTCPNWTVNYDHVYCGPRHKLDVPCPNRTVNYDHVYSWRSTTTNWNYRTASRRKLID